MHIQADNQRTTVHKDIRYQRLYLAKVAHNTNLIIIYS